MKAARRRFVQDLHRAVGGARGEVPEVARKEGAAEELVSKLTMMPFSRISEVPEGGTGMSAAPWASMSHQTVFPSASYTLPDWSQRRMRVWRVGSVTPEENPLSLVARVMVLAEKSTVSI